MIAQGIIIYARGRVDVEIDHDVGKFLRYLFLRTYGIKLQRPSNGEHIGIVSDREKYENILYLNGEIVHFNIDLSVIYTNKNAYWVNACAEKFNFIRAKLGLNCPDNPFHLCIGYEKNY